MPATKRRNNHKNKTRDYCYRHRNSY